LTTGLDSQGSSKEISHSDDVNELDGFISLGPDGTGYDVEDEPAYNPKGSGSSSTPLAPKATSSFLEKVQQQGKKRRKEKGEGGNKKGKKIKR
jgi:hypothetical protein